MPSNSTGNSVGKSTRERIVAVAALLVILAVVNWSIWSKEKLLDEGQVVYLELAPVDPRSLMQGDYMALRFRVAQQIHAALPKEKDSRRWRGNVAAADGLVVVGLDTRNIGTFRRIHRGGELAADEMLMRYRVRNGVVKFATNAFYFEEGSAELYEPAEYGRFRVAADGDLLLEALYDKDLAALGPGE